MDENKKTNQRKNPKDADTEDNTADIESKIGAEESEDESLIASFSKKFSLGKKALQERAESLNNDFQQAVEQTDETIKRINKHSTLLSMITRPADWKSTYSEYKARRNKEKEDLNVYGILFDGASPSIEYYMLTILSCVIATTGLIQGSTAVIIGAMIVAPLMTPILASSLGVIWGDFKLMRMSFFSLVKGAILAILISSALAYIIPLSSYSDEILARTTPSLFDILVALASGSVGAYGYANKKINNTLVGIAIAVALMPPLCTIGIGLGTLNSQIAIGATVLFLINYVSISLAGAIIFM
ncbi:MAG TPA: TIGR00341 family protein, partial [Spirochaetota bacterium]|nr:TIGR00341 family protein [Spirochaetota bacterium]